MTTFSHALMHTSAGRLRTRAAAPIIMFAALASLAGCAQEAPAATDTLAIAAIPVRIAQVAVQSAAEPVRATGILAGRLETALSFKVGGVVARIHVREGDEVRAGQLLATLDPVEIDAAVSKARSAAEQAERDLRRIERLYADSVATLAQLERAGTGAMVANADLRAASFNRRFAAISAPSAGTVLRRLAEPDEQLSSGSAVLVLRSAAGGAVVRVGLADRDVVRLRTGAPATVRFDAYPGETFTGRVTEIAAAADAGTGTYGVEVAIDATGRSLATGLVGAVQIVPATDATLLTVPITALVEADGDSASVFVLGGNGRTVRRQQVRVAFVRDGRVALRAGVAAGARVVVDGASYLQDGAAVRLLTDVAPESVP